MRFDRQARPPGRRCGVRSGQHAADEPHPVERDNSHGQIARLEFDIARRIPTNSDEVIFDAGGTIVTDRKAIGEKILLQAYQMRVHGIAEREMLGTLTASIWKSRAMRPWNWAVGPTATARKDRTHWHNLP